ncbi:hypothetical protein G6F35_013066 [Rhizopus arrhizus]|nr:hypothetical protein G6F35_013066 [Rhizopus arrhizus]
MHQVHRFGLDGIVTRRLSCLSMFWHFLDLVWICGFTFVYLREFPEELHRRLPAVAGTHAGVIRRRHDGPGAAREPVAGPGGAVHRAVAGAAGVFPAPGRVPHAARQHRRLHLHGAADRHHRGGFAVGHAQRQRKHDAHADVGGSGEVPPLRKARWNACAWTRPPSTWTPRATSPSSRACARRVPSCAWADRRKPPPMPACTPRPWAAWCSATAATAGTRGIS